MWKWIAGVVAVPVALVAVTAGVGAMLPREHRATAELLLPAPPERVAAMVRDVEAQPRWRSGVTEIELRERSGPRLRYVERSGSDAIAFEFVEEQPGTRFRSTITDEELPFGGFWTITLQPEGGGTRIRIEEEGHVGHPIYRFVAALIIGHDSSMKTYLADLERALAGA
jgi:uncharacterized protein YndB with AHSA1/START domain